MIGRQIRPRRGGRKVALLFLLFCVAGKNLIYCNEKLGKRAPQLSGRFFVPCTGNQAPFRASSVL